MTMALCTFAHKLQIADRLTVWIILTGMRAESMLTKHTRQLISGHCVCHNIPLTPAITKWTRWSGLLCVHIDA